MCKLLCLILSTKHIFPISRVLQINLGAIDLLDENLYTAGEIYDWEISFLRPGNSVTNK